jgi:AcrR family transcriptional regulator
MSAKRQPVTQEISMAFLELLTEKPFMDITVTDVVKRAGVARASFYRNYSSTSELLDSIMASFTNELKTHVLPVAASQNEKEWRLFLYRFIAFIEDRHLSLMLSNTTNISVLIFRIFDAAHELSKAMEFDGMEQKYSIPSRLGAIAGVVMHWINNGQKETPEEIVDYLMSFILTI